jgi:hypothetical protein
MEEKRDLLKPFKQHGVVFRGTNATQAYGDCPFTGKQNKFYVNKKNQLWDSKTAGLSGNVRDFIDKICRQNQEDLSEQHIKRLAENRGLPVEAFEDMELGYSGKGYTFPCRDEKGGIRDLRMFHLGKKLIGTAGCPVFLFGVEDLVNAPMTNLVFLCEGEWDTIAMRWLIKKLKLGAVAVGVPGATTFKREWVDYFKNRDVVVCYDNDEAGEQGEVVVKNRLSGVVNSLVYLHWSANLPTGYDLRDLISQRAIKDKKPRSTKEYIENALRKHPRKMANEGKDAPPGAPEKGKKLKGVVTVVKKVTFEDVKKTFEKWMYMPNTDIIKVVLSTHLSTHMPGDPDWLMVVAPPGGMKTEIINSFSLCPDAYITSSLTPKALVSGSNEKDGVDPSMLPKLDQKTLYIKDFTVLLGKKEVDKEEIFSIFRDAYDGSTSKDFGNGIKRHYKVHFSMVAGCTPVIYNSTVMQAGLGERYLKYYIGDSINHPSEMEMMRKAVANVSHEFTMRDELAKVIYDYTQYMKRKIQAPGFKYPTIPDGMVTRLLYAVKYASYMRGTVTRDMRNNEIVLGKPFREVGTRFAKNVTKKLINVALVSGHEVATEDDYRIVKKIILDTVDQRAEEIVRKMYVACPTIDDAIPTREVARLTKYNTQTITRILNDFNLLGIVTKLGKNNKYEWTVSETIRELLVGAGLYTIESERERRRADEYIFENRPMPKKSVKVRIKKK